VLPPAIIFQAVNSQLALQQLEKSLLIMFALPILAVIIVDWKVLSAQEQGRCLVEQNLASPVATKSYRVSTATLLAFW